MKSLELSLALKQRIELLSPILDAIDAQIANRRSNPNLPKKLLTTAARGVIMTPAF